LSFDNLPSLSRVVLYEIDVFTKSEVLVAAR